MKYLIFGTGDYYNRYKKWFDKDSVLALLDNSPQKQNTFIDGIEVLSPARGVQLPYDAVIILSFYVKSMKEQLLGLGVPDDKIYHFYDLHKLIKPEARSRPVRYFGKAFELIRDGECKNKILLLSQDLTFGGPSLALFQGAVVLKAHGYDVVYGSMMDGPLREKIEEACIPVVVDENLQVGTMQDCGWLSGFSLIVCNTINFHVFLSKRNTDISAIWWLHDSLFFYDGVDKALLQEIDQRNLRVVSVGPVPRQAIQSFLPDLEVGTLNYGVLDAAQDNRRLREKRDKVCFLTIGYIENRKGQDILIQAIGMLPEEDRKKAEFYLVGQDSSLMAQQLKEETADWDNIFFTGTVDREEIHRLLTKGDVLICPSREDPMPTVAAEAMMHSLPCILSDAAGTAEYICDGRDGFVFPCQNVSKLAEKIGWCINHCDCLYSMGAEARKIYVSRFSSDVFERELVKLTDACLNSAHNGAERDF